MSKRVPTEFSDLDFGDKFKIVRSGEVAVKVGKKKAIILTGIFKPRKRRVLYNEPVFNILGVREKERDDE